MLLQTVVNSLHLIQLLCALSHPYQYIAHSFDCGAKMPLSNNDEFPFKLRVFRDISTFDCCIDYLISLFSFSKPRNAKPVL